MRCPANRTWPWSARWNPETTLNTDVLPAPFGPIKAVIEAFATDSVAPLTAGTPPKRFTSPSTSRMGGSFKEHLLPFAQQPLRAEVHQADEEQSDDDQPQIRAAGRIEVGERPDSEEARARKEEGEDHSPERHRPDPSRPPENHNDPGEECRQGIEVIRAEEGEFEGVQHPRDAAKRSSQGKCLELAAEHVLSQTRRCFVVLSDR